MADKTCLADLLFMIFDLRMKENEIVLEPYLETI